MPNKDTKPIKINKNIEGVFVIKEPIFLMSASLFNLDIIMPRPKPIMTRDIVDVKK